MPSQLASLLYGAFIVWLVVRDVKANPRVSHALWIPLAWMVIAASRLPSEWAYGPLNMASGNAYAEGSPLDRNIFLILIILGIGVVTKRSVSWSSVLTRNWAIVLFFCYAFLSIAWSDYPIIAFKRWHKVFGHIVMALVVYTDREPEKAFNALFRRCGYILVPLSVLFIKYYPDLGRGFDNWTGEALNLGVTTNKNALGNLGLVIGLFFLASLFAGPTRKILISKLDRNIGVLFLAMSAWLVFMGNSSNALVASILGTAVILGLQKTAIRRHFSALMLTVCLAAAVVLTSADVKESLILALGEDTTLTGRTELWEDLDRVPINPLLGAGFESFWLGERLAVFWEKYWWHPNQAHNGYFEMYLNLGLIGVLLQGAMILSCYCKANRQMLAQLGEGVGKVDLNKIGQFRLAFLLALVASQFTDAAFKAVHLYFFVFFVVALEYSPRREESENPVSVLHFRSAERVAV